MLVSAIGLLTSKLTELTILCIQILNFQGISKMKNIDANVRTYSFVAIPFPNTAEVSESAPNPQRFQNSMRPYMFFPDSALQIPMKCRNFQGAK